jgi:hypothetical protein
MALMRKMTAAALVLLVAAPAAAQSVWNRVGSRPISDSVDRDAIPVQDGEVYSQIVLCSDGAPLRLNDVTVRFRDGGSQDLAVRDKIERGGCTDSYDLRAPNDRHIDSVAFTYQATSGGRPARVRLMAR